MDGTIVLYNPGTGRLEEEEIHERDLMRFLYTTRLGAFFVFVLVKRRFFSRFYAWLQNRAGTRKKIVPFMEKHGIPAGELEKRPGAFGSFADFFVRRLKEETRPFAKEPATLISPCDGRLYCTDLKGNTLLPVKGVAVSLSELLPREDGLEEFHGGRAFVFRLAPMDYHRFCHIDDGSQEAVKTERGCLHSVNPLSLVRGYRVYASNYRQYSRIATRNFGIVIWIEVGALTVGGIHQNKPGGGECRRGEEKGWFEMGGSTIIIIFKAGAVKADPPVMEHSAEGIETLVRRGMGIGAAT
jgi:phosphatidylserine decarboxylase